MNPGEQRPDAGARRPRVGFPLAVTAAALAIGLAAWIAGTPSGRRDAGDAPASDVLRERVALAREDRPYLVLDPAERTLTLYQRASPLRVFPVQRVQAGARRIRVPDRPLDRSWRGARWDHPRLHPPVVRERRTILSDSVAEVDLAGADPWIPPTPEEAVPSPDRFTVRYAGGLGVEIVAADPRAHAGVVGRVSAALASALWSVLDRYRVRVTMSREDVGALYRSFPTDAPLLLDP